MTNDKAKILLSEIYYIKKDNPFPFTEELSMKLLLELRKICANGVFEKYIQHVVLSENEKKIFDNLYKILVVDFNQYFDIEVILESYYIVKAKLTKHPSEFVLILVLAWIIYAKFVLISADDTEEELQSAVTVGMFTALLNFFEEIDDVMPNDISFEECQEIFGFHYMFVYECWAQMAYWLSFEEFYDNYDAKKALPLKAYHSRYVLEEETASRNVSYPSEQTKTGKGCYIATCVYGSYDCPEVRLLRRFRDNCLMRSLFGRLFIRVYYSISPYLVKKIGHSDLFKMVAYKCLSPLVRALREKGVSDSPYSDK